ncbi:MAG TPA: polymer-forming cytoskeletal protein [Gemmatimonadales bacterium]|nr:polymer-forming cytoskeletal protein [Gemmatimonadales bacterium]
MRDSGAAALLALLLLLPSVARAEPGSVPTGEAAVELVRNFWDLVGSQQGDERRARPQPQALQPAPKGTPQVDLSDLSRPTEIENRLERALAPSDDEIRITVRGGSARLGDFRIGSAEVIEGHLLVVRGDADVYGRLNGNLVTVEGDVIVHPGALVSGDILALGGDVRDMGGEIGGEVRTLRSTSIAVPLAGAATSEPGPLMVVGRRLAGVLGVFLTLAVLGFGLVMFARPNLEVISDTVSHSFGRAFVTGLLGQILVIPTFGMLIVGLILSVAGILLLPFAVAVYALLVVVGALGGFLAVAHAMGETYTRRRMAMGAFIGSPNSYRFLVIGLGAIGVLWLTWSLFGWVPVAGNLVGGAAFLATWLLATAGFGAALLSRAGIRENFAGRLIPPEALTDEYLWATPQFGVPAARRPGGRTPTRGL